MKNLTLIPLIAGLMLLTMKADAKTDVVGSLEQLKDNVSNSQSNLDQYKNNVDITSGNIKETTDAVKELRVQKAQLISNGQNVTKNKALLDQMKLKIEGFKAQENEKLKLEEAQIAEVRALLEKLEANKVQRQTNLAAYDQKVKEIEQEKADWDQQKNMMVSLLKDIDNKEKDALAERAKWIEKRAGYKTEATKWEQTNKLADQTYTRFKKLQD